ncbi:MAG: flavin monoamine oxidase family protein [Vicinamibacterales bacterium]
MLQGVSVLVAGAGLAGLVAARDVAAMGASVTVVDARDRVGGRVCTVRAPFADGQHAESGGDLIDASHAELLALVAKLGLDTVQILRRGWAHVAADEEGRPRLPGPARGRTSWTRFAEALALSVHEYRLAERRWDSPITVDLARRSVARWLDEQQADASLRSSALGLRGFFLADPGELSLAALVDQFASDEDPAQQKMYRVVGGNDRIAQALAAQLGERLQLQTELVAVSQRGRTIRASLKHKRKTQPLACDFLVCTLPASIVRRIPFTPALPSQQHDAIASLRYGRATRSLLQFSSRFWRAPGAPSAYGSPLAFGAVWDGNEEQRGRAAILSLLAGGSASEETGDILRRDGAQGLVRQLDWLGSHRAHLLASHHVTWEDDPYARGGYAFFDPGFDPQLRPWLARPFGRIVFAGEHTSLRWQGYMNGAVESGRRAAAEVAAAWRLAHRTAAAGG